MSCKNEIDQLHTYENVLENFITKNFKPEILSSIFIHYLFQERFMKLCKRRFVLKTMAIPVVEFSREGYKIRKIFG